MVEYNDSRELFKVLGGKIETDAQFAKLLYKTYGEGIYSVLEWRKGVQDMHSFMKVELTPEGFRLLPKKETQEDKEIRDYKKDLRKIKMKMKDVGRNEIELINEYKEEINDLQEDISFNTDIKKLLKSKGECTTSYLRITQPKFKLHGYEDFLTHKHTVDTKDFW